VAKTADIMLNMSESGDAPAVGEVPVQDGSVPLRSAAMDAYRVFLHDVSRYWLYADAHRSSTTFAS
jgi:hypothetical protein